MLPPFRGIFVLYSNKWHIILRKAIVLNFEYDINKSNKNKEKHGIDFEEADVEKMRIKSMKTITAKEFDEKFDNGEDISEYLDFSSATRLSEFEKSIKTKNVNIDFPEHIINFLDKEAQKIGITRESIIKVWIAERLKKELYAL